MKLRKRIALITVLIIILNLFSPYSVLFKNTVSAVSNTVEENPVIINNLGIKKKGANRILTVQIAIASETLAKSMDLNFKITDTSKFTPCHKTTGAANTTFNFITAFSDYFLGSSTPGVSGYKNGEYRIQTTEPKGGTDIVGNGYTPSGFESFEDAEMAEIASGYAGYYPVVNLYFKVLDDTIIEAEDVPQDLLTLVPITGSVPTGGLYIYIADNVDIQKNFSTFGTKGFKEAEKNVQSIAVKTNPTNTTYEPGDTVNLTGGEITVTYDDGTSEDISMTTPGIDIIDGNPVNINKPNIKISYKGKEATFPITINDPIVDFTVKTSMNKTEYNHPETLDFTGLTFEVTKKSGAKEILTTADIGSTITASETAANTNSSAFTETTPAGQVPKKGKQVITFTHSGIPSKTATQTIIVNDKVKSIEVTSQPNKKIYKRGEALDLTGAVVTVTLESNTTVSISLPDGSVILSNYSTTTTGSKQQLTATLAGHTAPTKIDVEWYDYIKSSELTEPTKSEYSIGDTALNLAGGRLKLTWAGKGLEGKDLTANGITVSALDTTTAGIKTITVTYNVEYTLSDGTKIPETITKTFDIEVVDAIDRIEITAPSKNTPYKHGEALAEGSINKYYKSAPTRAVTVPWSSAIITEADGVTPYTMSPASYDSTQKVDKTLKISYSEDGKSDSVNYPITIINDVKSISVHSTNHKTTYNIGDALDIDNLEILVTRAQGSAEAVVVKGNSKAEVKGFNSSTENASLSLTIEYTENGIMKSTSYNVIIADSIKEIVSVNLPKKDYKYNEELDFTGATITYKMGSGDKTIPLTQGMVTGGYNKTVLGDHRLTITYNGVTYDNTTKTPIVVNVKDYVSSITVNKTNLTGNYGTDLATLLANNGLTYTVNYAKAGPMPTSPAVTASMIEGTYNPNSVASQSLTVKYRDTDANSATNGQDIRTNITVKLENSVTGVSITQPSKVRYMHNDALSLAGGSIVLTKADGGTENVSISNATVKIGGIAVTMPHNLINTWDEYIASGHKITKTVELSYTEPTSGKSATKTYSIDIINDVKSIAVHGTGHKTSYVLNEPENLTGLEIAVTRAVNQVAGVPEVITVKQADGSIATGFTVSGFKSNVESSNVPITVTYTENTISEQTGYSISVTDGIKGIRSVNFPNTEYKYNDELNLTRSNNNSRKRR